MKVVILEPIGLSAEKAKAFLSPISKKHEVVYYNEKTESVELLIERAKEADILVIANMPLRSEILQHCTRLKMISVAFTGIDHIDMEFCRQKQIVVSNAAGYSTHAVAELAVGSAVYLYRKMSWCDEQTRKSATRANFLGNEIHGKRVGIIGSGAIGTQAAKIFHAMGAEVVAYSRTQKQSDYYTNVSFDELIATSDIISLHLPLTKSTQHIINAEVLAEIKRSAILINTARGPIVDSRALANSLERGEIAAAAIDVYEKEPPLESNHPLFSAPNTLLLPHIGYATEEAIVLRTKIVIENILRWEEGHPINVQN